MNIKHQNLSTELKSKVLCFSQGLMTMCRTKFENSLFGCQYQVEVGNQIQRLVKLCLTSITRHKHNLKRLFTRLDLSILFSRIILISPDSLSELECIHLPRKRHHCTVYLYCLLLTTYIIPIIIQFHAALKVLIILESLIKVCLQFLDVLN